MLARAYSATRFLVLVGIVSYLGWRIAAGWPALEAITVRWDALSLLGAFVSGLAAYQCLFVGWLILLRKAGYYEPGYLGAYSRIWWASYLYRYVPGKVLLLVERARMGSAVGIPPGAGAALVVVETLLLILAAAGVSLLALPFYTGHPGRMVWIAGASSAAILFLVPVCYRKLSRHPRIKRLYPGLESVALRPSGVLAALPAFVLHYLLQGLSFFLWARTLEPFPWSALAGLSGIYALSHLLGLVIVIAPAGLGVREGALGLQLLRVLPSGAAEAVAVGVRVWFILLEVVSFAAVMMYRPGPPEAGSEAKAGRRGT